VSKTIFVSLLMLSMGELAWAQDDNGHLEISTNTISSTSTDSSSEKTVETVTEDNAEPDFIERVSPRLYSITVNGDGNDSKEKVLNKALYKASKKTLKYDYDWFRIVENETEKERVIYRDRSRAQAGFETVPERHCGLLGCTTRTRTHYSGHIGTNWPDKKDEVYSITLEFEMGIGRIADYENVYDARKTKRDLK